MGSTNGKRFLAAAVVASLGIGVAGAGVARAQSVVVTDPASTFLDFGLVNLGATSTPRRITLQNVGAADPLGVELYIDNPAFAVVGTGGDLGPGHSAYWDLTVSPTDPYCSGIFNYRYRDSGGDDFAVAVYMGCTPRRVPLDAPTEVSFSLVGPGTTTLRRITVVNTSAVSQEIDALTSSDPTFSVRLRTGNLPLTVAPEGSFQLEIRFAPTAPLTSFDSAIAATLAGGATAPITDAHGVTSDVVTFTTSSQFFPVPVGRTWRVHAAFANYTAAPVTLTGIAISDPAFAIEGIAAGDVLPAYATVPVYVAVTPTAAGPRSASYTLTFDTAATISDGWSVGGMTPQLKITTNDGSPDDGLLDFGELTATSPPVTKTVTLSNPGAAGIYVDCQMFGTTGDGFTSTTACPNLVMPGDSVDIPITFTPAPSEPGAWPDRRISAWRYTELGTLHVVIELTALIPSYDFTLSAYQLELADTPPFPGAPTVADVAMTNTTLTPIPIPAATITGDGFSLVSAPPAGTLAPFATITYRVGFAPQAAGAFAGVLHLGDLADVPLRAAGVLRMVSADAALDFGSVLVGVMARKSITIHNAGATPVSATSLIADDPQFQVTAPADPTIAAGGDLVVALDFTPTAAGARTGRLDLGFDADPVPQLSVALSGLGVAGGGDGGDGDGDSDTGCCSTGAPGSSIVLAATVLGLLVRRRNRRNLPSTLRTPTLPAGLPPGAR